MKSPVPLPGGRKGFPLEPAWWFVLAGYVLVYGGLLLATHGLPYAIDNNESFSDFWHARNLNAHGLTQTKGLAEEVFAWHPAAGPYVHTHQGNFPRLFTLVLHLLGARSIESQIVITTFTVGLAAIYFAFRLFRRLGNPLFAVLACLVLITDYALLGQWQMNTYRVWYSFFFFSSLLWVESLGPSRRWPMLLAGTLTFAAMFYGEYVYAGFVGLAAALYALGRYWRKPDRLAAAWLVIAAGGALAALVLVAQLTAYMGWDNMLRDIRYTLTARNSARDPAFAAEVNRFYAEHHIIFWQNYLDTTGLKSAGALLTSLFSRHLQYYGPTFVLGAFALVSAWLLALPRWLGGVTVKRRPGDLALGSGVLKLFFAAGAVGLALSAAARHFDCPFSVPMNASLALPISILLGRIWTGQWWGWTRLRWKRLLAANAWAALVAFLVTAEGRLYDPSFSENWSQAVGSLLGLNQWGAFAVLGASATALSLVVLGPQHVLGKSARARLRFLPLLFLGGAVAYVAIYRLFTGYIYSGYLNRQAPFLIFLTDTLVAVGLYIPARLLAAQHRRRLLPVAAATAVLGFGLMAWGQLQRDYFKVIPPDQYRFLRFLDRAPYRNGSFVTNTYPAPIAAQTHSWAYAESTLFSGQLKLGTNGFTVDHDDKYRWFADAQTNPAYLKPAFGLLVAQPASIDLALQQQIDDRAKPRPFAAFDGSGLVERSLNPAQSFLQHELTATDRDHYSIVKFDWDFPAFLQPMDKGLRTSAGPLTLRQKLALSQTGQSVRRRWHIELTPVSSPRSSAAHPEVAISEALIDHRPMFSPAEWQRAGWSEISPGQNQMRASAEAQILQTSAIAESIRLNLAFSPDGGLLHVAINDVDRVVDLRSPQSNFRSLVLTTGRPHGWHTFIPSFTPGVYLTTETIRSADGPQAVLHYRYAQQDQEPEANTVVRIYQAETLENWRMRETLVFLGQKGPLLRLEEFRSKNPDVVSDYVRMVAAGERRGFVAWFADSLTRSPGMRTRPGLLPSAPAEVSADGVVTRRVPLTNLKDGQWQLSLAPGTATKSGPEYFGLPFTAVAVSRLAPGESAAVRIDPTTIMDDGQLHYGRLKMRLRFPSGRYPQAEPLVSSGVEQAGDFIYVIYPDPHHIRIGFDHWFEGGTISPPIAIDFDREHELEISMGALFPPADDIVFADVPPERVATLKDRVVVRLDGQTIIDAPGVCYDSPPQQLDFGENRIHGTSSNPKFSGQIISLERIWPDGG